MPTTTNKTTWRTKFLLVGWLVVAPIVCAVMFGTGVDANAAATGLSAKDIRTAAPTYCINLDGGVVAAEGASINLLRADAKLCVNGTLANGLGGPPPACAAGQHVTSSGTPPVLSCTADTGSVTYPACVHPGQHITSDGGTVAYCANDTAQSISCASTDHLNADGGVFFCSTDTLGGGGGFGAGIQGIPNSTNSNSGGLSPASARSDHVHACTAASATQVGCVSTTAQAFAGDKTIQGVVTSYAATAQFTWDGKHDIGGPLWNGYTLQSDTSPYKWRLWAAGQGDEFILTANALVGGHPGGDLELGSITTNRACTGCVVQEAWSAPTLPSGVSASTAPYVTLGYMKDTIGFVHLRGDLVVTTGAYGAGGCAGACEAGCDTPCNYGYTCTANVCTAPGGGGGVSDLFTLPAGYRPSGLMYFPTSSGGDCGGVKIDVAGTVRTTNVCATGHGLSIDGVTFDTR